MRVRYHHFTELLLTTGPTDADNLVTPLYIEVYRREAYHKALHFDDTVQVSTITRERQPSIKGQPSTGLLPC